MIIWKSFDIEHDFDIVVNAEHWTMVKERVAAHLSETHYHFLGGALAMAIPGHLFFSKVNRLCIDIWVVLPAGSPDKLIERMLQQGEGAVNYEIDKEIYFPTSECAGG